MESFLGNTTLFLILIFLIFLFYYLVNFQRNQKVLREEQNALRQAIMSLIENDQLLIDAIESLDDDVLDSIKMQPQANDANTRKIIEEFQKPIMEEISKVTNNDCFPRKVKENNWDSMKKAFGHPAKKSGHLDE